MACWPFSTCLSSHSLLSSLPVSTECTPPSCSSTKNILSSVPISAGGVDLLPQTIGIILGALGFSRGFTQILVFPTIHRRFGPKKIFMAAILSFFLVFPAFPLMHAIAASTPHNVGDLPFGVWVVLGLLMMVYPLVDMGFSALSLPK